MTKRQKFTSLIANRSVESLKEMVMTLKDSDSDDAAFVEGAILDNLMARMPEAEFVAFCDAL